MRHLILCGLLLKAGCVFSDRPLGPVGVTGGMAMNGDALVVLNQGWQRGAAEDDGIYTKNATLFVRADGHSERADAATPMLAADCSVEPPQLGTCTAATLTQLGSTQNWSYELGDGSRIELLVPAHGDGTISRFAQSGLMLWSRGDVSKPLSAIWGSSLLILGADNRTLEKIRIENGESIWTFMVPAEL